jgi:allophanate hydrolase
MKRIYATPDQRPTSLEFTIRPEHEFGGFVAAVPPPLAIGTVKLDDGTAVKGFICEAAGISDAEEISRFGSWRNYLSQRVG